MNTGKKQRNKEIRNNKNNVGKKEKEMNDINGWHLTGIKRMLYKEKKNDKK